MSVPMENGKRMQRPVEVIDTSLRDGLQSPMWDDTGTFYPSRADKIAITNSLIKYGVGFIEVFSPIVNGREKEDLGMVIAARDQIIVWRATSSYSRSCSLSSEGC